MKQGVTVGGTPIWVSESKGKRSASTLSPTCFFCDSFSHLFLLRVAADAQRFKIGAGGWEGGCGVSASSMGERQALRGLVQIQQAF